MGLLRIFSCCFADEGNLAFGSQGKKNRRRRINVTNHNSADTNNIDLSSTSLQGRSSAEARIENVDSVFSSGDSLSKRVNTRFNDKNYRLRQEKESDPRNISDGTDISTTGSENELLDCIVKIHSTHCKPNYVRPWQMEEQYQSSSSGFAIYGKLLLTNAHCVEHATVVRVKRRSNDKRFIAKVLVVGGDCDLALLTVEDDHFWKDMTYLNIGKLPRLHDNVTVVGYPIGGDTICITAGVVSRIEMQEYSHGEIELLAIQIDAAINHGSSGGPALNSQNEVVGIAFQVNSSHDSDNIGYLIPENVVHHFLTDYRKNGKYTGFASCGFKWQSMENVALGQWKGMSPTESGILVRSVEMTCESFRVMKEGDVVTVIDGEAVTNTGTVYFRNGEWISFQYLVREKFVGDTVRLRIFRDKNLLDVSFKLKETSQSLLVPSNHFQTKPEYLIVSGIVFLPLTKNYIVSTQHGSEMYLLIDLYLNGRKTKKSEQVVIVSQILNAEITVGYEHIRNRRLLKFNSCQISSLSELSRLIDVSESKYLEFEFSDQVIVIERENAIAQSNLILGVHSITHDRNISNAGD